jgi:hypothetical protein
MILPSRELGAASDEIRTVVLMRALAYDDALVARAGSQVVLALLTPAKAGDSAIRTSLRNLSKVTVRGLPITVVELTYSDAARLQADLREQQVSVLYLAAGLERAVPEIVEHTRALKVRTLTSELAYLKSGASLGAIDVEGSDKPRLMVNVAASQLEGMKLTSQLLQVAQKLD